MSTTAGDPNLIKRIAAQAGSIGSLPAGSDSLGLRAETDPGSRGNTYVQCETFVFEVRLQKPAYVMLLDLDSEGNLTVLYPTSASERQVVAAGAARAIPGADPKDHILVTAPFGSDQVAVLAFERLPDFFVDLTGAQRFAADGSRADALAKGSSAAAGAVSVQQITVHTYPGHRQRIVRLLMRADRSGATMTIRRRRVRPWGCAIVCLAASGRLCGAAEPVCSAATLPSNHALIITVSEYQRSPLPGVLTDRKLANELARRFGVPTENIVELSEQQVTREGLKQALAGMSQVIMPGDKLYVYFSGHGARFFSKVTGQCTESIVMQDMHVVTNTEFANMLKPLSAKTDKTIVMLDSCHSGGVAQAGKLARSRGRNGQGAQSSVPRRRARSARWR